ncbi:hypothetical protein PV735_47300 [Streptomyces turgidiscabies]|uniref:hypothetical protein n=1 Tax=Streptomyces turgidiscabies TaxID=85558 RepID=UPI001319E59E|nr:hypothetical protein [Streptomyces turgidiscabies]MDX3500225.1 hypothetical protein [Streptomyces turgidiscabies]
MRWTVYIRSSLREACTVTTVPFSPLVKSTLPMPPASPERITSATASLFGCHNFGSRRAPVS